MPICKRDGFDNHAKNHQTETFHDNDDVFFCEVTKEIFRDYEDYFRHVIVINSTVWQCEATGRENLTYAEALKSERRARKKMEQFKDCLRPPVMLCIEHAKQSSLKSLTAITFKFLRRRYFLNEEVTACYKTTKYNAYKVMSMKLPSENVPSDKNVYEETEKLTYKLKRLNDKEEIIEVPFDNIRRGRSECTTDNLQMFIRNNVTRIDGILRPKPESYQKYIKEKKISLSNIFIGKMPHFTPAKIKRPAIEQNKKQSSINKYLTKNDEDKTSATATTTTTTTKKVNAKEQAKREQELKAKSLKEEMERVRLEKLNKLAEMERERVEKRAALMKKIESECDALLIKSDDLERTDQRLLPMYTTVQTAVPIKLIGDAFMLREFMHSFSGILSGIDVFKGNLNFLEMVRSFTVREVAGPLSDILVVLLGSIFDLQREEEEECSVDYLKLRQEVKRQEPFISMSNATGAHIYTRRHFIYRINELPIDALTLTEVLRLHLLSSGACVKEKAEKWRMLYRNGYSSYEDPGFSLRMRHPHILRALKNYTVFQLPYVDIMRIIRTLIAQILTYSTSLNLIEERMENTYTARLNLRNLNTAENRRQANVNLQKRTLTADYNIQCMNDDVKNDAEKKSSLEVKLNKQIAELLAHSDRDRKKYEQQAEKLKADIFNFLVFLGQDRAYRKYYVFESMPGIFIEHPIEVHDDHCLSDPPKNVLTELNTNFDNLPKTRKELRSYLLRMYTEREKQASINVKNKKVSASGEQDNKENQANQIMNGHATTNGHENSISGEEIKTEQESIENKIGEHTPSQYELYMCTGDRRNCIVHDARNTDRKRWSYLHKEEDIDSLINTLNPLGDRESKLREQLINLRVLIVNHVKGCPTDMLVDINIKDKYKINTMTETYRKYTKSNFGFKLTADLNEVMQVTLSDRILQFEKDIYTGDLGRLKVKQMRKWREDIAENAYDPQGKLQWGPSKLKLAVGEGGGNNTEVENVDNELSEDDDYDGDVDGKDEGYFANRPYCDPGKDLGDTLEIDSEDSSEEEEISLHDSSTLQTNVKTLASALLQVEQAIEKRFLKHPFGPTLKESKKKDDDLERTLKNCSNRLKQWEVSLMESTSYSQVFLHLNILHDSVIWARSTNKSMCQVCRRGSDPDKMLLCDECNGGTHMFCMKPKMKTVPEGNWYCTRCIKRLGVENEKTKNKERSQKKPKRTFVLEDENNVSDTSSISSPSVTKTKKRTKKRLQSEEIEEMLEEDDDVENEKDEDEEGEDDIEEMEEDEIVEESEEAIKEESSEDSDQDDENVCAVCSYDGSELMCTRCKDTFHMECLNLKRTPRYNFICSKCKTKEDKKRKYKEDDEDEDDDETDESLPPIKKARQSRSIGVPDTTSSPQTNSRRSNRRTAEHLPLNSPALYKLLEDVMKLKEAWPFLRPVSQTEVPDYYQIIKTPMDLAKVKSKLNMGQYQLNEEVMKDIQLIFKNCDRYNVQGNEIYELGVVVEKFIVERCKDLNLPFEPSDLNQ